MHNVSLIVFSWNVYQFVSSGTRPLGPKNRWAVCALYANDRPSDYWLTALV